MKLAKEIVITNELNHAINGKDFLVLAVPSIFTRSTARKMSPFVAEGQMIVDVAKGIEEATLMTLSEQIHQEIPQADVAVLSGPSHAEEVGRKLPTTCVHRKRKDEKDSRSICSRCSTAVSFVFIRVLISLESSWEEH